MKILIAKEEGLGNAIELTPVISRLYDDNEEITIDVLSSDRAYEVMARHPNVNKVYRAGEPIAGRYDYGFNTCFRIGAFDYIQQFCDKFIFDPDARDKFKSHSEIEINIQTLLNAKLLKRGNSKFYPTLFPVEDIYEKQKMILLHAGCHSNKHWEIRKWPAGYWIDLVGHLKKEFPEYGLCFLCGEHEEDLTGDIASAANVPIYKDTLEKVAALMMASDMLISIDSGIMHLGTTTGIKQIALFGPTSEIKSKPWVPDDGRLRILRKNIDCERCYINNKPLFVACKDNICMKTISPGWVLENVKEMLR